MTALEILRARAATAREALEDCAANAPWDVDHCRRAVAENEALAELLETIRSEAGDERHQLDEIRAAADAFEASLTTEERT